MVAIHLKCKFAKVPSDAEGVEQDPPNTKLLPPPLTTGGEGGIVAVGESQSARSTDEEV